MSDHVEVKAMEDTMSKPLLDEFMYLADIKKEFHIGYKKAKELFEMAEKLDEAELRFRVFENRVRRDSVYRIVYEKK